MCCIIGVTPGLAAAAGGQVAFRAPGVCPAPPLWLWAQCSCYFFPWCQGVVSCFLFGCTEGCLVLCVALFAPLQCALGASCRCQLLGALFVCAPVLVLLVRARGQALRLGVCLLGCPAAVCARTPIDTIASLCNKTRRNTCPTIMQCKLLHCALHKLELCAACQCYVVVDLPSMRWCQNHVDRDC